MLFCCHQRNIESSCHTLCRRLASKTNSVAHQRLASSTRWSVAAKCIQSHRVDSRVYCTSRSQHAMEPATSSESRFLPTLPAFVAPVRGVRVAIQFSAEKLDWLGYPKVKTVWRYNYSFRHNSQTWQTHGHTHTQTPHDGIARKKQSNGQSYASGRESVVDEKEPGRCVVSTTDATITAVDSLMRSNRRVIG